MLALVYLELLGGRQHGLLLDPKTAAASKEVRSKDIPRVVGPKETRLEPRPQVISNEELAAHNAYIEKKLKDALWLKEV